MKKLYSILNLLLILAVAPALIAQSVTPNPSSLSLSGQTGGSAVSQQLTLNISGNAGNVFITSNAPWLKVNNGASAGPLTATGSVTVSADPSSLPSQTTPYSGALTILWNGPNINVPVSFIVTGFAVNPASANFSYQLGSSVVPAPQNLVVAASQPFLINAATFIPATGGNWLVVSVSGGTVTLSVNGGVLPGLAPGTYNGSVRIQTNNLGEASIPVTLTVAAAPAITVSPASVNLFYQLGSGASTNVPSAVITLNNPGATDIPLTAIASVPAGNGNWLTVTPATPTIPANGSTTVNVAYNTAQALAPNTYSGANVSLFLTGASNPQVNVPVTLRVSAAPFMKLDKTALTFTYQMGSTTPSAQSILATSTQAAADAPTSQQMVLSLFKNNPSSSTWLTIPTTALFTGSSTPITVSVNPTGLTVGTYKETVTVLGGGAANSPQTFDVTFTVSNDPFILASFGGCTTSATTCTLNFPVQLNQNPTLTRGVRVQSTNGTQASFTATATMAADAACGNSWLSTGASAAVLTTDTTFQISVNPGSITAPKTCTGTITIAGTNPATGAPLPNSPVTIPVNMYISNSAMLVPSVNAVTFAVAKGAFPTSAQFTVASTSADVISFTTAAAAGAPTWLIAPSPSAATTAGNQNTITVIVNPTSLDPGTYSSSIVLTATTAGVQNSPVTIPVVVTVTAASLTATPSTLSFQQVLGTNPPSPKTVQLKTDSTDIIFTTNITTAQGAGWLTVTPSNGTVTVANPVTASIGVNGSALPAGTYHGTVTFTPLNTGGAPVAVAVTLEVQPGTISASPASLAFTQVQGGTAPDAKTIAVTGTPGALSYTVAVTTDNNSGNWLTATPGNAVTNSNVQVSVNSGSLTPGQYTGKVTITSTGASGSPISVPVTLTVASPQTFTANPTSLNFSYVIGTAAPQTQTVTVTTAAGTPFSATVTPASATWLTVTPASGTGTTTLTVGLNTAAITAAGDFTATIAITSPNAATNPAATVTVKLSATAIPKPVITAVSNAASYVAGAISPGENIVIFGTGIGPATITSATVSGNAFPTTVGSTQVFFDNIPAPILYVSGTQTSVMVPYGVAGRTTTNMRVVYSGVTSDTVPYNVVAAAPGVYTANSAGSGQGAILNQDFSPNTASRAAAKDSVVAVYLTGEGVTNPASTDGRIAPSDGSGLFKPVLPVTATVGGQSATVEYYGSAPGILYGVMQVNVRIPANAASGNLPIVINVGSNSTQANVTVAVQ